MLGDVQKVDSSLESTRAIRTSIAKSLRPRIHFLKVDSSKMSRVSKVDSTH
ncbi:hypothetical protein [Helicobacter zhangjianzhongii]|uniref:Uncharacterized protein n=1 Tax=Helicobacter zhangjianzhongii TaxID=2974574 RepID=A0ACC6FVF7_9HELI|nr:MULTISPECIES: hypothetical protein [unclassified Helicobacter]MDL0081063.1 hypothetical protein [Helicobacter sp. CPD2-1]MDL0083075.1 hypothetical protein [Helicobacter sp. XJK30-2]